MASDDEVRFSELACKVVEWGRERGLLDFESKSRIERAWAQFLKVAEEAGETWAALGDSRDKFEDGIGDTLVTMILLAEISDVPILSCLPAYSDCESSILCELGKIAGELARGRLPSHAMFTSMAAELYELAHVTTAEHRSEVTAMCIDCLGKAYNTIKDRQGKTVGGVFIKAED